MLIALLAQKPADVGSPFRPFPTTRLLYLRLGPLSLMLPKMHICP